MVQVIKVLPSFPNGIPGVKMSYPFWDAVDTVDPKSLKGVFRGDILFFEYNSRAEKDKLINSNPMLLFEGVDPNGNIVGTNIMFMNMFIDPKTEQKSINKNQILPVINMMKSLHFDEVYQTGVRKPFLNFERKNYKKLFGAKSAVFLDHFWRVYDRKKMVNVMNLNPDSALSIISMTPAKFVKSKLYIR